MQIAKLYPKHRKNQRKPSMLVYKLMILLKRFDKNYIIKCDVELIEVSEILLSMMLSCILLINIIANGPLGLEEPSEILFGSFCLL